MSSDQPSDRNGAVAGRGRPRSPVDYVSRHWRGDLPLGIAFWVNLVAVRFALVGVDQLFGPPFTTDIEPLLPLALGYVALSVLVIYPWQVMGVLRTTDRLLHELGSGALVLFAQIGIVVSLLVTGVSAIGIFHPLWAVEPEGPDWFQMEAERAARYSITVAPQTGRIHIAGDFELGMTKRLRAILLDTPGAREIVLESNGGYVGQGRAVARVIEERDLSTRVETYCESACVLAFMAGTHRTLVKGGKLGFHPYRLEGSAHPTVDPRHEFTADSRSFIEGGVDPAFLARVAAVEDGSIWYPTADELLAAGIVDSIVEP